MEQNLLNIGFGNSVVAERVIAIVSPNSSPMKRLKDEAKDEKRLVDATHGRKTRAIIVTDSNHIVLSAIQSETLSQRFELLKNASKSHSEFVCEPGHLFIVSAPSGAGKTTLCRAVLDRFDDIRFSISHTTRKPRPGETDGVDYYFVSEDEFRKGIENGKWAEWAEVHGNLYGTSAEFLDQTLAAGKDVLLDIDVQGAKKIVEKYPESVTIFIMPPSIEVLKTRLMGRGPMAEKDLKIRLANAEQEMAQKDIYRHIIVNDRLPKAGAELASVIESYRMNRKD